MIPTVRTEGLRQEQFAKLQPKPVFPPAGNLILLTKVRVHSAGILLGLTVASFAGHKSNYVVAILC